MAKRYQTCPTCGGICEKYPPFPKDTAFLHALQDRELRRLVEELHEQLQRLEARATAAEPNEYLQTFTVDELMRELKRRFGVPDPVRWSELHEPEE